MYEADRLTWTNLERVLCKRFGTDKLLDSPIRKLSTIRMKHNENVREYIDRFNRIRHACPEEPHLSHTITWFISGLSRGIHREMKKASTYRALRDAFEAAMDLEDEYAASEDESDRDSYDKRSRREEPRRDSPPKPSTSSVIREADIREIAKEVTKQSHEEVLQAIEKKLHITGEREGIRCT